jgi:glycosyltransferase involved in cell wall biosynthesis
VVHRLYVLTPACLLRLFAFFLSLTFRWSLYRLISALFSAPEFAMLRQKLRLFLADMYREKKVVVVMPAYNAGKTLLQTYNEVIEQGVVDLVIIVDDASNDNTTEIARTLPKTRLLTHLQNLGYGGNQKTCYRLALEEGADIVIMVHPDYQYTPKLIPAMASMIANDLYSCVLGSRILGGYALKGGMPAWKYVANRFLTLTENLLLGAKLSEYHTGYRAFSRELLQRMPLAANSNDFLFDNQMLAQILWHGYTIAEVSCPTKYFAEASSINFRRSLRYGVGCLFTALTFRLAKLALVSSKLFPKPAAPSPSVISLPNETPKSKPGSQTPAAVR